MVAADVSLLIVPVGRVSPLPAARAMVAVCKDRRARSDAPYPMDVAASRQSAANVTGILDGGFLPKAATRKSECRRGNGAHSALRNPNFALEWLFSGFHFAVDDWGKFVPCLKQN